MRYIQSALKFKEDDNPETYVLYFLSIMLVYTYVTCFKIKLIPENYTLCD